MSSSNCAWPRVPIRNTYHGLFDGPHATPPIADSGPVFLGIGNVTDDGHLDLSAIRHISEEDFPKWTKRVTPQTGDIVFTYEATLNRYAMIPEGFRGCLGRRMALIRPNHETVDPRFLFYYFFGHEWRETVAANILSGATVDRIPLKGFPDFPISLPPLPLQHRIASILSTYDDLIENNTRRIAILEEMAQRLYEEWFVRFRFPGHEEAKFDGDLPPGWRTAPLNTLVSVNPESIKPKAAPERIHYIDIASVSPGRIDAVNEMAFADAPGRARRIVRDGDMIWSCVRPNRRSFAVVLNPAENTVASTGFAVLRARAVPFSFLYCAASTDAFVDYLTNQATGAAYPAVKQSDFERAEVTVPQDVLLTAFDEAVQPALRLGETLRRTNTNLRAQRDLLLPKLVSGEIDVSEAEEGAVAAAE